MGTMGKAIWIGGAISSILAVWERAVAFSAAQLVLHLNEAVIGAVHRAGRAGAGRVLSTLIQWQAFSHRSGSGARFSHRKISALESLIYNR
jgi:hypothetical protein